MLKKILLWIVFVSLFALLIIGFSLKDNMNNYLSKIVKEQAPPNVISSGEALIDSLYNYSENGLNHEITFLEFGAKGCVACRKMETVMDEIKEKYPEKINVIFQNTLKHENQLLMKYYGIAAIPTQVLLDKEGKEFFRHTGYFSTSELTLKIINHDEIK